MTKKNEFCSSTFMIPLISLESSNRSMLVLYVKSIT